MNNADLGHYHIGTPKSRECGTGNDGTNSDQLARLYNFIMGIDEWISIWRRNGR